MSQENVELARRGFEAWEPGHLETHLRLVHEDVVCRQVGQIDSKTYHGLEGYIDFASEWLEPYEELQFRPSEFIDAGGGGGAPPGTAHPANWHTINM
jgi:hypothetical protein